MPTEPTNSLPAKIGSPPLDRCELVELHVAVQAGLGPLAHVGRRRARGERRVGLAQAVLDRVRIDAIIAEHDRGSRMPVQYRHGDLVPVGAAALETRAANFDGCVHQKLPWLMTVFSHPTNEEATGMDAADSIWIMN